MAMDAGRTRGARGCTVGSMIGTHANTTTDAPRTSRRQNKPAPDADALVGMRVLGLKGPKPRASRYAWFIGRNRVLSELGRTTEKLGDAAARMIAERVLVFVGDGIIK